MRLAVIGTGYVGLVSGCGFAEMGNDVVCVDIDADKVRRLSRGEMTIHEPGLETMLQKNLNEGRLTFTTDLDAAVRHGQVLFIAVGTPPGEDGSADLSHVLTVARGIAAAMNGPRLVVVKSTVPVGSCDRVRDVIAGIAKHPFSVLSNPEFLKEGAAVDDFMYPDRIVIGTDSEEARQVMRELYAPFVRTGGPIIFTTVRSSEMIKYAANAMLATRISFMNEIANLCEAVGADVNHVRQGIGSDPRIGPKFLFPGVGYGGSCFPKDVRALIRTAEGHGVPLEILKSVEAVNTRQKRRLVEKIDRHFAGDLRGRTIAVWGLAFKAKTDDMREAPSLVIIQALVAAGAQVRAFDPVAARTARPLLPPSVVICENNYEALEGADALAVVTEWNEFRNPDFERMAGLMRTPVIFDGRNLFDPDRLRSLGFTLYSMGR